MPGTIKDLARRRAEFAFEQVKEVVGKDWSKEFKSHVKDVPMMIKTNGFAATFAFVFSKSDKNDYKKIAKITELWLVNEQKIFSLSDNEDFYEKLIQLEPGEYRKSIKETLALFTWLKRFADGLIKES